jgi:hypothetical protein
LGGGGGVFCVMCGVWCVVCGVWCVVVVVGSHALDDVVVVPSLSRCRVFFVFSLCTISIFRLAHSRHTWATGTVFLVVL